MVGSAYIVVVGEAAYRSKYGEVAKMRKRASVRGVLLIAFGAGLFLAYCFPTKFIIIALALTLVLVGVLSLKC